MGWAAAIPIVAGAAAGAFSGGERRPTTTQRETGSRTESGSTTTAPWSPSIPHLEDALAEAVRRHAQAGQGGGGGAGLNAPGRPSGVGVDPRTEQVTQAIVDRGMGGDPLLDAAQQFITSGLAGDTNPYRSDLASRLGRAGLDSPFDYLEQFIQGGGWEGAGAPNAAGGGGAGGGGGGGGYYTPPSAQYPAAGQLIPDAAGSGLFGENARRFLDPAFLDPASDPTLAPYMDMLERRIAEATAGQVADVGDQYERLGGYGGSGRALEAALTRGRGLQASGDAVTQALKAFREQGLGAALSTLGLVNTRDISAGDIAQRDRATRAAAESSAAATAAASGSAAAARDLQLQLGTRGQNLEAILGLMSGNLTGLGMLGDLGRDLSSDQLGFLSMVPGISDASWGGLERAHGAALDVSDRNVAAERELNQWITGQRNRAQTRADEEFGNYLRQLGFFAGMGGTTTSQGTSEFENFMKGIGPKGPSMAQKAIAGGAGGLLTGLGAGGG